MKNNFFKTFGIVFLAFAIFAFSVNALSISSSLPTYDDIFELNMRQTQLAGRIEELLKEDSYPNYFGGIYISDDSKNVVLQIVEKNLPEKNSDEYCKYNKIVNMEENIKIEYVDNSYNELQALYKIISEEIMPAEEKDLNISSTSVDIIKNKVEVALTNNTSTQQKKVIENIEKVSTKKIKSNDSNRLVNFVAGEIGITTEFIFAGGKYTTNSSGGYCSMGFRTRYNGMTGYVTAGHCSLGKTDVSTGTIVLRQFANNQNYDYAFVKTNSTYTPSNYLAYPGVDVTQLSVEKNSPYFTVNTMIAKSGAGTGYSDGKITKLNCTRHLTNLATGESYTIGGLVQANIKVDLGDSGGTVFLPIKDANGGARLVGIISGGTLGQNVMFFTSIDSLPFAFLTGRY